MYMYMYTDFCMSCNLYMYMYMYMYFSGKGCQPLRIILCIHVQCMYVMNGLLMLISYVRLDRTFHQNKYGNAHTHVKGVRILGRNAYGLSQILFNLGSVIARFYAILCLISPKSVRNSI